MESRKIWKIKRMQREQRRMESRSRERYERLYNKIEDLENKIDTADAELKDKMEDISKKGVEEILSELGSIKEFLRILAVNELLDELDLPIQNQ